MEEEIHLLDYVEVIKRRRWVVLAAVVVILTVAGLITFLMQPVYQASATLKIGRGEQVATSLGRGDGSWESEYSESLAFKTHSLMITSLPVLSEAARTLKLNESPGPQVSTTLKAQVRQNLGKIKSGFLSLFSFPTPAFGKKADDQPEDPYLAWAGALRNEVAVSPIRDTRLIEVSVSDSNPAFCQTAANTICQSYIDYLASSRVSSIKQSLAFFSDELSKMKSKLEESENQFYAFKQQEKIFSLQGKKDISAHDISSLSADLLRINVERSGLEEKANELEGLLGKGNFEDFSPAILGNQILFELRADLIKAKIELEEFGRTYKEKHPTIIESKAKIQKLQEHFNNELRKTVEGLAQEIAILKRKEERLASQMTEKEGQDLSLSGKELRYAILEREAGTNKELYEALLTNIKQMEVLKGIGHDEIRLVEEARLPLYPIKPRPLRNLLLALLSGAAVGVGLAFFLEYMDRSIKYEHHVERYLKLPVLSLVPKTAERLLKGDMVGETAEAFRNLATSLKFQALDRPMKVMLVTSPGVEEGKTTTVRNLGSTLANAGAHVLMIDADLKLPALGQTVAHTGEGLSELLQAFPAFQPEGCLNDGFSFGDVQRLLYAEGKSGTLTVNKGNKRFEALFDRGRLIDLCWQNRPPERRLGQILLRNQAIAEDTLNDALVLAQSAHRRMGSVLLSLHSVAPEKVEDLLDLHVSETMALLNSAEEGRYQLAEGRVEREGILFGSLMAKSHLQGGSPWLEKKISAYLVDTEVDTLQFLPGGVPLQNPLPLISSRRFEVLLSILKDNFDFILLDAPPLFLADAASLSQYADSTILVLMSGRTRPEQAKRAVDILRASGTYLSGVVLNGLESMGGASYYSGRYHGRYLQ
jgi:polysaccharide biosynthesis transport protein